MQFRRAWRSRAIFPRRYNSYRDGGHRDAVWKIVHIDRINLPPRPSTVVGAFNAEIFLTDEREYGAHTALYITMPSISSREQASETAVAKKRKKNCRRTMGETGAIKQGKCGEENAEENYGVAAISRICDVYDSSSFALKFDHVRHRYFPSNWIFFFFFKEVTDSFEKKACWRVSEMQRRNWVVHAQKYFETIYLFIYLKLKLA